MKPSGDRRTMSSLPAITSATLVQVFSPVAKSGDWLKSPIPEVWVSSWWTVTVFAMSGGKPSR
jgi:hypothetical protein